MNPSAAELMAITKAPLVRGEVFSFARLAKANRAYRRVVYTDAHQQVALMSVVDFVPSETHMFASQAVHVASGSARITIDCVEATLGAGESIVVPPGAEHKIERVGTDRPLKLWVTYAPPLHGPLEYDRTRADAKDDA